MLHIEGCHAALAECHANQLDSAFHQLESIMFDKQSQAGCRTSSGARTSRGNKGKPCFERQHGELRAQCSWALCHDVDSVKVLVRRCSSVIPCECQRQYRQQQTPTLLLRLCSNHIFFWQQLNAHVSSMPLSLFTYSAWTAVHQSLSAPPAARNRAIQPHALQPPPPVAAVNAAITQD